MTKKPVTGQSEYERVSAEKDEFFLAASHQLKAPLAIIQWCLQTALESPKLEGETRDYVSKSLQQASAMTQLVTDMLHVVRLSSRKGKSQTYVAVDVHDLIDQILKQYEQVAQTHKVHLMKGPMENLPPVFVDEAYFRQALINLVDNAIKYSPNGGKVEVSVKAVGKRMHISVKDEGIGMTEADQAQLFTEFFRADEAKQVAHEGTGLGLVLVKHVIEEFGGQVLVESTIHKGTTFTVQLPLS